MNQKKIVIIGATSAIAQGCAKLWAQDPSVNLILVGRDTNRIDRVAATLRAHSPHTTIHTVVADFLDPTAIQVAVDNLFATGPIDIVLIAHGSLPEQEMCQENLLACHDALTINGISPVLYAEACATHMAKTNHGTLAIIGSVAGDRGRKSNYVYGAAKGIIARYAQGLQHRFAGSGVTVVLIKPGPTDTPMTAHLKGNGTALASVDTVAQQIVDAISRGRSVVYVPGKWVVIMMILRHLPAFIFNRLNI